MKTMTQDDLTLAAVREALQRIPRMNGEGDALGLTIANGVLTIKGEVPDIGVKRRALDAVDEIETVSDVVDRLTIDPGEAMSDRQIRDHFRDILYRESAFADFMLVAADRGAPTVLRRPADAAGRIEFDIDRGIVTLTGTVSSPDHKRLAGMLAWRLPGRRDVLNDLETSQSAPDTVAQSVKGFLDQDKRLDASSIAVSEADGVVRLSGQATTDSDRDLAEIVSWYVFGVEDVVNDVVVS
jgi:osmotically-inducible protein OsmY